MRDRLFTPLGLTRTVTLPEEALLHSAAVGHVDVDGEQVPSAGVGAAALGRPGRADHRDRGRRARASPGCTWPAAWPPTARGCSRRTRAAAMTAHQADLPDKYILGDSWGLGWIRFGWDGQRLIGHDGNTLGPGRVPADPARAGPRGRAAHQRRPHPRPLRGPVPRDVRRARRRRDAAAADATGGARHGRRHAVRGQVRARRGPHGGAGRRGPPCAPRSPDRSPRWCPTPSRSTRWSPVGPALFAVKPPKAETWAPVTFYELPTGERYVHFGVRATPRVRLMDLSLDS